MSDNETTESDDGTRGWRVAEGTPRDAGRSIARLDPEVIEELGLDIGDVVAIDGASRAVARVMPTQPDHRDRGRIQLDGILRDNAGVALGDRVSVEPIDVTAAERVEVEAVGGPATDRELEALGAASDGIPVRTGTRFRVALPNNQWKAFDVVAVSPATPGLIEAGTRLDVVDDVARDTHDDRAADGAPGSAASGHDSGLTYEDIGGLDDQMHRIREVVELPLRQPEVFRRMGIDPPRGVLLHGPPGCGKTLLARVLASEVDATFHLISGPEVIQKHYGESEAELREVFGRATQDPPSLIFVDEIDSLAPKRDDAGGDVEKRVVATLLTLMDGLEDRPGVLVVAATNRPDAVDPALRRPGRFDREVSIPVPGTNGRREILEIHTRGMPLGPSVELGELADETRGFVGADLAALCREAAMRAVRRKLPDLSAASADLSHERLRSTEVGRGDFTDALREMRPSSVREVVVEVPEIEWEEIGGLDESKRRIVRSVMWPIDHEELFEHAQLDAATGVLLHGPPGCGKTLLARAAATEMGVNFLSVRGPELVDKFVGESERNLRELFDRAREAAPAIVFFDEFDAIAARRDSAAGDGGAASRLLNQLLVELDGIESYSGVMALAATNRLDRIDPAILRPGRFDEIIEVAPPGPEERAEIFDIHLRDRPVEDDISVEELARASSGFTGADIAEVCRRATLRAVSELLESAETTPTRSALEVRRRHLDAAISTHDERLESTEDGPTQYTHPKGGAS